MSITHKCLLQIKTGREKIGVNFTGMGTMYQDEDGKVFFNKTGLTKFDFIGYEFSGPVYHDVLESHGNRKEKSNKKGSSKEKGKFGMGGVALGLATGGLSMAVGVGRKKTKGKTKDKSIVSEKSNSTSISKQTEVPSTAILNFQDDFGDSFSIMIVCDSVLESNLRNFKTLKHSPKVELVDKTKSIVQQLKEFKELLDLGIITQEEFDSKKYELLQ